MEKEIILRLCSFSTDFENYSPLSIIKHFFSSKNCHVNNLKKGRAEFDYNIDDKTIHTQLYEISDLTKKYNIGYCSDFFLIFVNLNDEEKKIFNKLDSILLYIKETYSSNAKFNILGILNENINNKELTEIKINDFITSKNIFNYEYMELKHKEDIENAFRTFACEIIENKLNDNKEAKKSYSKGICYIY